MISLLQNAWPWLALIGLCAAVAGVAYLEEMSKFNLTGYVDKRIGYLMSTGSLRDKERAKELMALKNAIIAHSKGKGPRL